ncbi:MAG: MBL fold metallo-hydrolase [Vicingaceae bacterium]
MKIEQIYTSCIAEAAYYIESEGEAAIIDPLREFEPYVNKADEDGAKIKYIFETHFHADFVSGHLDLAKKTGASIVYGPTAQAGFDIVVAKDGQDFEIGKVKIRVLHTPGHTMESSTYLLIDEQGKEHAIFTGDTLFLGDVGRPDLAVKTDLTEKQLASYLFDSLREKIMPLPDEVIVYPGHGAGSSCGKNLSSETVDTLGNQKKTNYALRSDMTREEFIEELLDGILPAPQYFPKNAVMNKMGYESIEDVMHRGNLPLSAEEFESKMKDGALILDVRSKDEFRESHIPGAMFIGLDGNFAMWVGALIVDLKRPIILVCPEERHSEAVMRLARVGYDESHGYLNGGMKSWIESGRTAEKVESITSGELASNIKSGLKMNILDVRKIGEYDAEHVEDARHFPLDYINDNLEELDKDQKYYVHCKSGYRSMAAVSIMRSAGIKNIVDIQGGMDAILETDAPVTDFACQDS